MGPCDHEEVDTRVFVHLSTAARNGYQIFLIKVVDTAIVVTSIAMFTKLNLQEFEFGCGWHHYWLSTHEYVMALAKETCDSMLFWYVLTGNDTVSSFCRRAKKTAWQVWKSYPESTEYFSWLQFVLILLYLI